MVSSEPKPQRCEMRFGRLQRQHVELGAGDVADELEMGRIVGRNLGFDDFLQLLDGARSSGRCRPCWFVRSARQQDHVRNVVLAGMIAALEPVDTDRIAADLQGR